MNGQKIWTSLAAHAKFGILIARTRGDVSKHRGISYFIIAMDSPGIEVRPIREMTGEAGFNEVFFTDVPYPAENLIGEENLGLGDGEEDARQRACFAVDRRRAAVGLRPERGVISCSSCAIGAASPTR